jgi:hypothetical protein
MDCLFSTSVHRKLQENKSTTVKAGKSTSKKPTPNAIHQWPRVLKKTCRCAASYNNRFPLVQQRYIFLSFIGQKMTIQNLDRGGKNAAT